MNISGTRVYQPCEKRKTCPQNEHHAPLPGRSGDSRAAFSGSSPARNVSYASAVWHMIPRSDGAAGSTPSGALWANGWSSGEEGSGISDSAATGSRAKRPLTASQFVATRSSSDGRRKHWRTTGPTSGTGAATAASELSALPTPRRASRPESRPAAGAGTAAAGASDRCTTASLAVARARGDASRRDRRTAISPLDAAVPPTGTEALRPRLPGYILRIYVIYAMVCFELGRSRYV